VILSQPALREVLVRGGVPAVVANLTGRLNGGSFQTVSRDWVRAVWDAGLEALRLNAPALVAVRQVGGGKTALVPNYIADGFNCRGQAVFVYAHGMVGFANSGAAAAKLGRPLGADGLAWGFLEYTAVPRADNLNRAGRHEQLWFVDHDGTFQTFEQGDGEENEMLPEELASVTFLYAQ
jgi:hypothetical protein